MTKIVLIAYRVNELGETVDGPVRDNPELVAAISQQIGLEADGRALEGFWSIEVGLTEPEASEALSNDEQFGEANPYQS